jgi:hypothetical protein
VCVKAVDPASWLPSLLPAALIPRPHNHAAAGRMAADLLGGAWLPGDD